MYHAVPWKKDKRRSRSTKIYFRNSSGIFIETTWPQSVGARQERSAIRNSKQIAMTRREFIAAAGLASVQIGSGMAAPPPLARAVVSTFRIRPFELEEASIM